MKTSNWVKLFTEKEELLKEFILQWHPASDRYNTAAAQQLPISVVATEVVRRAVTKVSTTVDMAERYDREKHSVDLLYEMLTDAWMGVPESFEAWDIPGFKEAVALLEDPPEGEGGGPDECDPS